MRKYSLLLCACLILAGFHSRAQRKLIEKFLSEHSDTTRNTSIIVLPAAAYAQETGLEFGGLSIASFYMDKNDTLTRTSTINTILTFTTKKQSNFAFKPDIWTSGNRYHYSAILRYKNFPFNFYGVGDETQLANEDKITQKLFVLTAEAEKLISRRIYVGINGGYEHYKYKDKEPGGVYEQSDLTSRDGGSVLFAGLSFIFDSRNTNTYTTKGSYIKLSGSYAPGIAGADDFKGGLFNADLRHFMSFTPKLTGGINLTYQGIQGTRLPFFLLPQLGNDQVMRGYYTGRYRDQNLLTGHVEIRYRFMTRFGIAGFTGTGTVFRNNEFSWNKLKPNYGGGLRYFAVPSRGLTMRADYAVGEKRPGEKRQSGFYLALAEAF